MSFGKILDTISSAAAVLSYSTEKPPHNRRDEETFVVEKKGLLDIDLNVAPPEDDGSFSPAEKHGGDEQETQPTAAAAVEESEIEGKERKIGRWDALLEVAEYEGNLRNKETRKLGPSRETELGGELQKATTPRKFTGRQRSLSIEESWNDDGDVTAAPPVFVVRSTRGRPVAMPNKYRDSAAWAEFARRGKSAAVVSTKRKYR